MDVTTVSGASAFQQQKIAQNVQGSVAAKVLESQKAEGAGVLKLLQAASLQSLPSSPAGGVDTYA